MIVFLFPGQGSQQAKMGESWKDHPSFEMVYEACNVLDRDLAKLLLSTQDEDLTATHNTQLAVFLLSLVILDAVESTGIEPMLVAGHSLGEYSALVASGGLTVESGLSLVLQRAEAMHKASQQAPQKMIALLGIDVEKATIATRSVFNCWVANDNSSDQVVIAGGAQEVTQAAEYAKQLGAKRAIELKVSGAFHTPYMALAKQDLEKAIYSTTFLELDTPVVANLDARPHQDASDWPMLLVHQLTNVVRWRESMNLIATCQPTVIAELGPGNVLSTLAKKVFKGEPVEILSIQTPADVNNLIQTITASQQQENSASAVINTENPGLTDKIVVAPSTGVFSPINNLSEIIQSPSSNFHKKQTTSLLISPGEPLGIVGETEVISPFAGVLKAFLVSPGDRVTKGQPLAWISKDN